MSVQGTSRRRSGETHRPRPGPDALIERYAPLLRFSTDETHFPIDPGLFVSRAVLRRYGWRDDLPDACWNARHRRWETAPLGRLPADELVGPEVAEAVRAMDAEAPVPAGSRANRRPLDSDNLWGGARAGYAFELLEPLAREMRGGATELPFVLYEHRVVGGPGGERHELSYWFFFALDLDVVAHEGDWERVSVLLEAGSLPRVRFGRGREATTVGFDVIEVADGQHPVVYVEQGSHRACRHPEEMEMGRGGHYALGVPTWKRELRHCAEQPWAVFDGAWGLVGQSEASTGPLGPHARGA